jgi:hypothetical protein
VGEAGPQITWNLFFLVNRARGIASGPSSFSEN